MTAPTPNAGMMDAAFQIGRKALLDWLNSTFSLHLARIEETANGAWRLCCTPSRGV